MSSYVRQFEEGKSYSGGSYDSNLSFIQALTEALKAVPSAVLLASLPESDKEAGSQHGIAALASLSHYFARVQALWKPVATEEAFEIVRRRLFAEINDTLAAESVCRAFVDFYVANSADLPHETQESHYFDRLVHAYPIHPEVFDRLFEDWSSLDNFQRTLGVLKLMAKDALRRLVDRLHYLNSANNRFWFDTRPNLRREMEERKRRFQYKEDLFPAIRDHVQKSCASGVFGGIHVFTASGDVPDDWALRLVVLPPDAPYSKTTPRPALERATEILKNRGGVGYGL